MNLRATRIAGIVTSLVLLFPAADAYAQHRGPHGFGGPIVHALSELGAKAAEVNLQAMHVYRTLPRRGTCEERRRNWLAVLPDAIQYARDARDVYDRNAEHEMRAAHVTVRRIDPNREAYFDDAGQRYAEAHFAGADGRITLIFRGTRLSVSSDISTNILNMVGFETGYYEWAATLTARVVQENPGREIIVTGHSLGGGLALYAALKNRETRAFVFNPAGLSEAAWTSASADQRAHLNSTATVVAVRNFWALEPAATLSFAGRSILPGHVFVLAASRLRPAKLHSIEIVISALESAAKSNADGNLCDGDLGVISDCAGAGPGQCLPSPSPRE